MTVMTCEKCGNALAPADAVCSRCGEACVQRPLVLRRLGIRLESESQWARAGQAFQSALALDDSDEIAHQLFIANRAKQGLLSEAKKYYESRLLSNSADAMASKQLNVIKLSADFLASSSPLAAVRQPKNALERWVQPSPLKIGLAALALLVSGVMIIVSLLHSPAPQVLSAAEDMDLHLMVPVSADSLLYDTTLWSLQAGLSALGLFYMYRNR